MTAVKKLQECQQKNNSLICLGLDLDVKRMPSEFASSTKGMFDFATKIIEATSDSVCAYKPNMAFYESLGSEGWSLLRLLRERIPEEIPVILDGKRGDIGNTASHYAQSLYEDFNADWVTLNPYMGYDSLRPFLEYEDKGVFILCLTSNSGSKDFQQLMVDGKPLYQVVAEKVDYWNKADNCGLVVGATHPDQLKELRLIAKEMPLLIPGVGAQGGSLENAAINGTDNFKKIAVINVSRSVLYASTNNDFAQKAREELQKLNSQVTSIKENKPNSDESAQPASDENNQQPEREKVIVHTTVDQNRSTQENTTNEQQPHPEENRSNTPVSNQNNEQVTESTETRTENKHPENYQPRNNDNQSTQDQNRNQQNSQSSDNRDQKPQSDPHHNNDQRSQNDQNDRNNRNYSNRYGNRNRNQRNFNRNKPNDQNQRVDKRDSNQTDNQRTDNQNRESNSSNQNREN